MQAQLARIEAQLEALTAAVSVLANSRGLDPGHVTEIIREHVTTCPKEHPHERSA